MDNKPYALVYQNAHIFSVYVTIDDTQIIFTWDERQQAQYKHPKLRVSKQTLPDCHIKLLSRYGCEMMFGDHKLEFKFDHNRKLLDTNILWHGPVYDPLGEWDDPPELYRNSPTSQGHYTGSYSQPQEYEEEEE